MHHPAAGRGVLHVLCGTRLQHSHQWPRPAHGMELQIARLPGCAWCSVDEDACALQSKGVAQIGGWLIYKRLQAPPGVLWFWCDNWDAAAAR